jgi:hypothetical protein
LTICHESYNDENSLTKNEMHMSMDETILMPHIQNSTEFIADTPTTPRTIYPIPKLIDLIMIIP